MARANREEIHFYSMTALAITVLLLCLGVFKIIGCSDAISVGLITAVMAFCWSYQEKIILS